MTFKGENRRVRAIKAYDDDQPAIAEIAQGIAQQKKRANFCGLSPCQLKEDWTEG